MQPESSGADFGDHLDFSSDPSPADARRGQPSRSPRTANGGKVRIYFGCCRVYGQFVPPAHVIRGDSDWWRVHCPRCGGLVEVLVQ